MLRKKYARLNYFCIYIYIYIIERFSHGWQCVLDKHRCHKFDTLFRGSGVSAFAGLRGDKQGAKIDELVKSQKNDLFTRVFCVLYLAIYQNEI